MLNLIKFERLLDLYWTYFFLYGGRTYSFTTPLLPLLWQLTGISKFSFSLIINRLEWNDQFTLKNILMEKEELRFRTHPNIFQFLNRLFGSLHSINHSPISFYKLPMLRKYLIRTFRGRRFVMRKPSHGQRTRSNGKTAKKLHRSLDYIILQFRRNYKKTLNQKKHKFDARFEFSKKKSKKKLKKWHKRVTLTKYINWF